MPWPRIWGSSTQNDDKEKQSLQEKASSLLNNDAKSTASDLLTSLSQSQTYTNPSVLLPTLLLTTVILSTVSFSRRYLTRYPSATHIPPQSFRTRSLFGRVTSVGDADNFRLYHTPGGRLAGWGWLRSVPRDPKDQSKYKAKTDETIHVRIAGVDAPELAHFGQPAQPFGEEALAFLRKTLDGRRVRVYLWRPDQYGRVVGTVYLRRFFGLWKSDIGATMLKSGMATVYEAKTGVEFGGKEEKYRKMEERAKGRKIGLWSLAGKKGYESPREFKTRTKEEKEKAGGMGEEQGQGIVTKAVKKTGSWLLFWKS